MSKSKDASSKLHEKHQLILADLLRDDGNKYCADCMVKGPRWASWNLGVFICIRCAGIHRNLGVHISRVKSVNLDSWTPEQMESIQKGGNRHAKDLYEANLPANFRRPQDDYAVEQFIRAKYERKMYYSQSGSSESKPAAKEPLEQKSKTKPKKATNASSSSRSDQMLSLPRPTGTRRSPSPQATKPVPVTTNSSSKLESMPATTSTKKPSPQPTVDLLTGLSLSTTDASSSTTPSSSASKGKDLLTDTQTAGVTPSMGNQDLFGTQAQQFQSHATGGVSTKDSIMSLYGTQHQSQFSSYTAQGYPVNSFYYQQQQAAAMRMAHMAALQQHQVNQVTEQMQKIKMSQHQHSPQPFPTMSNGGVPGMGVGGQTLNPTLW